MHHHRHVRRRGCLGAGGVLLSGLLVPGSGAAAGIVVVSQRVEVQGYAYTAFTPTTEVRTTGPDSYTIDGFDGVGVVQGMGTLTSRIGASTQWGTSSISVFATGRLQLLPVNVPFADYGESSIARSASAAVRFSVDVPTLIQLSTSDIILASSGQGAPAFPSGRLVRVGDGSTIWSFSPSGTQLSLDPGLYELRTSSLVGLLSTFGNYPQGLCEIQQRVSLVVVPAPGGCAALAVAAALGMRRRR